MIYFLSPPLVYIVVYRILELNKIAIVKSGWQKNKGDVNWHRKARSFKFVANERYAIMYRFILNRGLFV